MADEIAAFYGEDTSSIDTTDIDDFYNTGGAESRSPEETENRIARAVAKGDALARKFYEIERAKELKSGEIYRKTDNLHKNSDGSLESDSSVALSAKGAYNAAVGAVDWVLEASENLLDVGQGDWLDNASMKAIRDGKEHSMSNKDFGAAENTTLEALVREYQNAEYDPMADKAIYTLRRFDGFNEDGSSKYIYKHGMAEVSAADRYKSQWMEDGFEIVEEKRFKGAEKWENTLHALTESLNARVFDEGGVEKDGVRMGTDKASNANFGAGYTEQYNRNLLGGEDPTDVEFARNAQISEQLMNERNATRIAGSNGFDALQAGLVKLGVGGADWLLDMFSPGGDNKWLNDVNTQEWVDKQVGYDRTESNQALNEAAWKLENGDILGGFTTAMSDPGVAIESLPMMIMAATPLPGGRVAAAAKLASTISKMRKLGKTESFITNTVKGYVKSGQVSENAYKTYKIFEQAPKTLEAMSHLARYAGFYSQSAILTNDQLNERIANKIAAGEPGEVNMMEVLSSFALTTALLGVERLSGQNLLKFGKGKELIDRNIKRALNKTIDALDNTGKRAFTLAVLKKAKDIAIDSGTEAAQEYTQTWGEIIIANYGIDGVSMKDIFNDEKLQHEAMLGLAGGLGAGGQIATVTSAVSGAYASGNYMLNSEEKRKADGVRTTKDLFEDPAITANTIINKVATSLATPGAAGSIADLETGDPATIVKAANAMVDRYSGGKNLDAHTRKVLQKQYIQNIIDTAFDMGEKMNQMARPEAMENILKLAHKLHQDPNVDFDTGDMLDSRMQQFSKAFTQAMIDAENVDQEIREYKMKFMKEPTSQEIADMKNFRRNTTAHEWRKKILYEKQHQAAFTQGSFAFIEGNPVEVSDDILYTNPEGLNLKTLEGILAKYSDQKNDKYFDDVTNEIENFGFIEIKYENGKKVVRIKPSMKEYDEVLLEQIMNDDKAKNIGSKLNQAIGSNGSANFETFTNWAKSRARKLNTSISKKGDVKSAKHTIQNLMNMQKENDWFDATTAKLEMLMGAKGDKNLTPEQTAVINGHIAATKSELASAKSLMNAHIGNIESFVQKNLGVSGFDINNKEHLDVLSHVFTDYTQSKDGTSGPHFGPNAVDLMNSFPTLEGTLASKRDRLLALDGTSSIGDISTDGVIERQSKSQSNNSKGGKKSTGSETKSSEPIEFDQEMFDKFKEQIKTYADLLDVQDIGTETDKQKRYRIALEKKLGKLENQDLLEKILEDYNGNVDNAIVDQDIRWLFDEEYNVKEDTGSALTSYQKLEEKVKNIGGVDIPWSGAIMDPDREEGSTDRIKISGTNRLLNISGRPFVLVDIDGFLMPFYVSSGSGGKKDVEVGKWYPVFGISEDGWFNKTSGPEINDYYGSTKLREVAEKLDAEVGNVMDQIGDMPTVMSSDSKYSDNEHIAKINTDVRPIKDNFGAHTNDLYVEIDRVVKLLEGQDTGNPATEESQPVTPATAMETFNNVVTFIESQPELVVDDIDTILTVIADTFADLKDSDKEQMTPALKRVIANVEKSISKDVAALNDLRAELISEKDANKANAEDLKSINKNASWLGSKIDAMKKIISNIRKKIRLLGKKAYGLIADVEHKRKFKYRLQAIESLISDGASTSEVMQTINDAQSLLNDIKEFKKHFEQIPKEKDYGLIDFFGVNLKTTFENHPQIAKFYRNVHSKLKNIKRGKDFDYQNKPLGWYAKEMAEEYDREKEVYLSDKNNTADFKTYKEFLIGRRKMNLDGVDQATIDAEIEAEEARSKNRNDSGAVVANKINEKDGVIQSVMADLGGKIDLSGLDIPSDMVAKDEMHMTLFGFADMRKINESLANSGLTDSERKMKMDSFRASLDIFEDTISVAGKPVRLSKQYPKNKYQEEHTRESLIVELNSAELDAIRQNAENLFDIKLGEPFPHATIAVKLRGETMLPMGGDSIGLANRQAFNEALAITNARATEETGSESEVEAVELDSETKEWLRGYNYDDNSQAPMTEAEAKALIESDKAIQEFLNEVDKNCDI